MLDKGAATIAYCKPVGPARIAKVSRQPMPAPAAAQMSCATIHLTRSSVVGSVGSSHCGTRAINVDETTIDATSQVGSVDPVVAAWITRADLVDRSRTIHQPARDNSAKVQR